MRIHVPSQAGDESIVGMDQRTGDKPDHGKRALKLFGEMVSSEIVR
jgi:hypothetical protein